MHQTFYIDIDEEITSIIERLRKAQAKEVVIVAPKRALLIQSIVNLRILKKEADDLGLALMIVTQDKLGKLLIEKAGILVQQKLDDDSEELVVSSDESASRLEREKNLETSEAGMRGQHRLDNIGSREYFDDAPDDRDVSEIVPLARKESVSKKELSEKKEEDTIRNIELVSNIGEDIKKRRSGKSVDMMKPAEISKVSQSPVFIPNPRKDEHEIRTGHLPIGGQPISPEKIGPELPMERKIEQFYHKDQKEQVRKIEPVVIRPKKNALKFALVPILLIAIAGLGYGAYRYLPKAEISIFAKAKSKTVETQIRADVNTGQVDFDRQVIPARIITIEDEVARTFSTSGSAVSGNQKARGKVTLVNEYGPSPQPLVATTRLLSPDGKLFRLVSGVTIPGTTKNGDQIQPGTVEAEVVADESGDSFNIGPTNFTIPGFKDSGNDKHTKIFARSSEPMKGGGSGGGGGHAISEGDISNAKTKILADITAHSKQKLKDSVGTDEIFLEDAVSNEEAVYKTTAAAGQVADNFEMKASIKTNAIVFKEADIKSLMNRIIANSSGTKVDLAGGSIQLDWGKAEADFKMGTLDAKVGATNSISASVDVDKIKREIAGKSNEDLESYLRSYPEVQKVEINYWPPFITGKVPEIESRIEVSVQQAR